MKFKQKHYYSNSYVESEQLVKHIVADQCGTGELETLRHRLDTLTEIVGFMATQMSEEQLTDLAQYFRWETK